MRKILIFLVEELIVKAHTPSEEHIISIGEEQTCCLCDYMGNYDTDAHGGNNDE